MKEGNYLQYVFLYERPYRLEAFKAIVTGKAINKTDPATYWKLLGRIWVDSENIWQNFIQWKQLWSDPSAHRRIVMDEDELAALDDLPETVSIYRGAAFRSTRWGLSWTTNYDKAVWFGKRGARDAKVFVLSGKVKKENVLAHFLGRSEDEIVALPHNITDRKEEVIARV